MKIKELLNNIDYEIIQGSDDVEIENISWDSRKVGKNSLFICVSGKKVDRHDFAAAAVREGAMALVIEHDAGKFPENITVIKVDNTKAAMAAVASGYYGKPSEKFNLIGITGTNGKTSVSYFIAKILQLAGRKAGIIGTIENRIGDNVVKVEEINPTTPDSIELQASFKEMLEHGATDVAMEVTSIGLEQHRVDMCDFDIGVFTNLTPDHLDEHGTMENYREAKTKLFRMCRKGIINADDPAHRYIMRNATCDILTYGIKGRADFKAKNIRYFLDRVEFTLDFRGTEREIKLHIPGSFSVYNALAAIGACCCSGLSLDRIVEGINGIEGVKGRFQTVPNKKGCLVVVDYAHTPDGLENILRSVRMLTQCKVITVFGCGGDRDKTKRPVMGEIAGRLSDYCIITSDNPRTEDPTRIIDDIEAGLRQTLCPYDKIENRKDAIHRALEKAQKGDIVIVAGKGHENYQMFGNKTIHFDDVEVVQEFFKIA